MTDILPFPTHRPVPVGVLGSTSLVGRFLIPRLVRQGHTVVACSRTPPLQPPPSLGTVAWCRPGDPRPGGCDRVPAWIALCPIWATVAQLGWLESLGVERLVAVSSTSLITKEQSSDPVERQLVARLTAAEEFLQAWAADHDVITTVLRPTMIYDGVGDGNVSAIASCVRRFGWFPLCGSATGLRQPVHADDVAAACVAATYHPNPQPGYTLSGGEPLSFHDLVVRTCRAHGLPPRTIRLPGWAWRSLVATAHGLGFLQTVSPAMGGRMSDDLAFDHTAAAADLGFQPSPFVPGGGRDPDGGSTPPPDGPRERGTV